MMKFKRRVFSWEKTFLFYDPALAAMLRFGADAFVIFPNGSTKLPTWWDHSRRVGQAIRPVMRRTAQKAGISQGLWGLGKER